MSWTHFLNIAHDLRDNLCRWINVNIFNCNRGGVSSFNPSVRPQHPLLHKVRNQKRDKLACWYILRLEKDKRLHFLFCQRINLSWECSHRTNNQTLYFAHKAIVSWHHKNPNLLPIYVITILPTWHPRIKRLGLPVLHERS